MRPARCVGVKYRSWRAPASRTGPPLAWSLGTQVTALQHCPANPGPQLLPSLAGHCAKADHLSPELFHAASHLLQRGLPAGRAHLVHFRRDQDNLDLPAHLPWLAQELDELLLLVLYTTAHIEQN